MNEKSTTLLLHSIKGAPMAIIFALLLTKKPLMEIDLVSITGYSKNTIRKGCRILQKIDLIIRRGRFAGYIVSKDTQLYLGIPDDQLTEGQKLTLKSSSNYLLAFNKKEERKTEGKMTQQPPGRSKIDLREQLLKNAGIKNPTKEEILNLPWCTYNYIRQHMKKARIEKISTGLLIHRMRCHDPEPTKENDQSTESYRKSWFNK